MREIMAEHGRDAASFPLSKRIYIAVNDDEARARDQVQTWLGSFYGRPEAQADAWAVYGSPAHCLDTLNRMREAGLTHFMLHPAPTSLDHLELIAERLAPDL